MTLLERFREVPVHKWPSTISIDKLEEAIAIAQAVEEMDEDMYYTVDWIMRRADELLKEIT